MIPLGYPAEPLAVVYFFGANYDKMSPFCQTLLYRNDVFESVETMLLKAGKFIFNIGPLQTTV